MLADATSTYLLAGTIHSAQVVGTVTLQDGSPCGTYDEFFGVHSSATATLLDAKNKALVGPVLANEFGDYALPANQNGVTVLLACEGASPVAVPYG